MLYLVECLSPDSSGNPFLNYHGFKPMVIKKDCNG